MILTVHAQPNSKKTKIVGWLDEDTIKIKIAALPHAGRANRVLVEFLADYFQVPKWHVKIVRGAGTRIKQVEIAKPATARTNRPRNLLTRAGVSRCTRAGSTEGEREERDLSAKGG